MKIFLGEVNMKRLRLIEETGIDRYQWIEMLRTWISSERDREIFERRYLDSVPVEQVAVEFGLSERRIRQISKEMLIELKKHIAF